MATASIPHDQRQPIPVVSPVPAPDAEQITALLSLFDSARAMQQTLEAHASGVPGVGLYNLFTIWADDASPHAEYAARLWASANRMNFVDTESVYEPTAEFPAGSSIRGVDVQDRDTHRTLFRLQWKEVARTAPTPSNVIPLPTPPATAAQPEAVTEPAQPRDLDESAARFAAMEF